MLSVISLDKAYYGVVSSYWPSTTGTILNSQVDVEYRTRGRDFYKPSVVYQYHVDYLEYTGARIHFTSSRGSTDKNKVEMILRDNYPKGAEISVYYNADNPSLAVLEPGLSPFAFWVKVIGFSSLVIGGLLSPIVYKEFVKIMR